MANWTRIELVIWINSQRGNRHINLYKETKEGSDFLVPNDQEYDNIIKFNRKPTIENNAKSTEMCEKNEKIYKENLINCLFK